MQDVVKTNLVSEDMSGSIIEQSTGSQAIEDAPLLLLPAYGQTPKQGR